MIKSSAKCEIIQNALKSIEIGMNGQELCESVVVILIILIIKFSVVIEIM